MYRLLLSALLVCLSCSLIGQDILLPVSSKSSRAKNLYEKAMEYGMNIELEKMGATMEEAVEEDANLFMAHFQGAMWAYFERNQLEFDKHVARAMACTDLSDTEMVCKEMLVRLNDDKMADLTDLGQKLVDMHPGVVEAHMWKANTHMYQGDMDGSISVLENINELAPDFAPAYNMKGYNLMETNRMGEARKSFDRYIKLLPDHPNPYDSKGDFYMRAGIYKNAEEMFQKALELDKNFAISQEKVNVAAAMAVAEYETKCAFSGNVAGWASCYAKGPSTVFTYVDKNTMEYLQGWESIYKMGEEWMSEMDPVEGKVMRSNLGWEVGEDMITLTYDQEVEGSGSKTKEMRVMKKIDGEWKLLVMNAVGVSSYN